MMSRVICKLERISKVGFARHHGKDQLRSSSSSQITEAAGAYGTDSGGIGKIAGYTKAPHLPLGFTAWGPTKENSWIFS